MHIAIGRAKRPAVLFLSGSIVAAVLQLPSAPASAEGPADHLAAIEAVTEAVSTVGAEPAAIPSTDVVADLPEAGDDTAIVSGPTEAGPATFSMTVQDIDTSGTATTSADNLTVAYDGLWDNNKIGLQTLQDGVRAAFVLTDPDAPTAFTIELGGDVSSIVQDEEDGTLKALDANGLTIATASAPWAVDAMGVEMETYYEINGTTVTQYVIDTGPRRSYRYPIVADPVWAVAIAAAARVCAHGALLNVAGTALLDVYHGRASSWKSYVENAIVGCLLGPVGSWVWRLTPSSVKSWAIRQVLYTVIYVIRRIR